MEIRITIDVPEAVKGEVVPEEMETMFLEFAKFYKEKREEKVTMKDSTFSIRDGNPELTVRIKSINVQGEI